MTRELEYEIDLYIKEKIEYYKKLIMEIAAIPAPSFKEEKRVDYIIKFLEGIGVDAYTDDVKNVVVTEWAKKSKLDCQNKDIDSDSGNSFGNGIDDKDKNIHLFMAHTDIVFQEEELTVSTDKTKIYGPGVGDDTTNVAALLMVIKFLKEKNIKLEKDILFAFNSCEEGLGNLKGSRKLFEKYGSHIKDVISFDLGYDKIICKAVGSKRFRITVKAKGGHSYNDFPSDNAIYYMAKLIEKIYEVNVDEFEGKNTYNIGMIIGGTSVNTIAQNTQILFEYRSDNSLGMKKMEDKFEKILKAFEEDNKSITMEVQLIGERPTENGVDRNAMSALINNAKEIIEEESGMEIKLASGSTDCNIFLANGIPSICYGTYLGAGEHTREEYVLIESLTKGLKIALRSIVM